MILRSPLMTARRDTELKDWPTVRDVMWALRNQHEVSLAYNTPKEGHTVFDRKRLEWVTIG